MARSRKYGKTWWGNAWVEAMERIDHNTNRLPRGRSYANGGRVSEINIDVSGRVRAGVRGTRPTPYRIEIKLKEFSRQTRLVNRFAGVKPDAGDKTARFFSAGSLKGISGVMLLISRLCTYPFVILYRLNP